MFREPLPTPCPILAAQKAQADEARAILRRRLPRNPEYEAAVRAWLAFNRANPPKGNFPSWRQESERHGGIR